jgi:DNA-binding NtrC family response regulator
MNLLLVDPERRTLEVYRDIFEIWGYNVTAVSSGKDAVNAFTASAFDLVIVDDNMPDLSGVELIRTLKSKAPEVPLIVMTANSTVRGAVNAIRAGADDYLAKSTDVEGVRHCLHEATGERPEFAAAKKLQAEILTNIRQVRDRLDEVIQFIEESSRRQADLVSAGASRPAQTDRHAEREDSTA